MGKTFIIIRSDGSRYRQTRGSGGNFRNVEISNQKRRKQTRNRSSSGGGSSTTKINIVSDAPEDKGKMFRGRKIQTTKQYNRSRRSRSSSGGGGGSSPTPQKQTPKTPTKTSKKVTTGAISPAPKNNLRDFRNSLYRKRNGNSIANFGREIGGFLYDGIGSLANAGKTLAYAGFTMPDNPQGIKARQKIAKGISNFDINQYGASLGQMARGTPAQKTMFLSQLFGLKGMKIKSIKPAKIQWEKTRGSIKTNLEKGSSGVNIETNGVLQNGKDFKQKTTFRHKPKDKIIQGKTKTTINGKTKTENFILKDKGAYYENTKTKQRIPKSQVPLKTSKIDIKETSTTQTSKDRTLIHNGRPKTAGIRKTQSTKTTISQNGNKKQIITKTKTSDLHFNVDQITKKNNVKSIKTSLTATHIKKRTAKQKIVDERKLNAFLEVINYDKVILNGLDKRTRLARALGLSKTSNKFKSIERKIKKDYVKITKSKGTLKGTFESSTSNLSAFYMGGGKLLLKKGDHLTKLEKKKVLSIPNKISIPDLKSRIKIIRTFKLKGLLPIKLTNKVLGKLTDKLKKLENKQVSKTKQIQKPIKKQIPTNKNKQKTKQVQKTKNKSKQKTKNKTPVKPTKINGPKKPIKIKKIKKIPKPKLKLNLNFNSKLPKGTKLSFDILYRQKGKIKSLGTKLPLNKALKRASNLVDRTTSASMELKINGVTTLKDVKKPIVLNKFRMRKTNKVLKLVEKKTRRIDTIGEKKGLSVAKYLKKGTNKLKSRKKKPLKSKSIKKKKK